MYIKGEVMLTEEQIKYIEAIVDARHDPSLPPAKIVEPIVINSEEDAIRYKIGKAQRLIKSNVHARNLGAGMTDQEIEVLKQHIVKLESML